MSLFHKFIKYGALRLKIPELAIKMFRISNDISKIDKNNIPTQLIPLNTIQLSRGLLNFTVFQSIRNWVLPYWAVKQYDPHSPSFIPRSHTGVSINITNRNWTGVGNMDCDNEPVVDPAGLIMPFRNYWSIDFWLQVDDEIFFPSYSEDIKQKLLNDFPIVETRYTFKGMEFVQTVYSNDSILIVEVKIIKTRDIKSKCSLVLSTRPFNPEGVGLIDHIAYIQDDNCFHIDDKKIYLNREPYLVYCSDFREGDAVKVLKEKGVVNKFSSVCSKGLANSIAVFELPEKDNSFTFYVPLSDDKKNMYPLKDFMFNNLNNNDPELGKKEVLNSWELLLNEGVQFNIPDNEMTSVIRTSISTLLMLIDKKTITPGPFTYHQFWFRDAVFMISALDNFNFTHYTKKIIENLPDFQDRYGYYRSQQGEWDSNGQAIWIIYKHYLLTLDKSLLNQLFPSIRKGIRWIDKKRMTGKGKDDKFANGLMPKGLSAEHLGLADYYYWDNFWSLAGVGSYMEICKILNYNEEEKYAEELYKKYLKNISFSITSEQEKHNSKYIPAAVDRYADYGMIGSIIPLYPLQIEAIEAHQTLDYIYNNFLVHGMFYQNFIHSGLNPYLTIQLAHSYLYAGDRSKFNNLFGNTIKRRTPVNNFPEAIHPITGGGCMGDGHHGWAAAEIVAAFRDSFLWEDEKSKEFRIFAGIPGEWFNSEFMMKGIPTSNGLTDLQYKKSGSKVIIIIKSALRNNSSFKARVLLPFEISINEERNQNISINGFGETELSLTINTHETIFEAEVCKTYTIPVKSGTL